MGNSMPSAPGVDSKLYELRSYRLAAQDAAKFKALACASLPVRAKRSRLVGFWQTEIGAINQVMHLWEYDSLNHRKAVMDDMASQADWTEFLEKATPMFKRMDNQLCLSLEGDLTAEWSDKDFYKITTVRYKHVWWQRDGRNFFLGKVASLKNSNSGTVVRAALETVIGSSREFILVESASNLQHFLQNPGLFDTSIGVTIETKILYPYPWSEWVAGR